MREIPTNALMYVNTFIHTVTLLHVSALKGPSSGNTDTFRECGQHDTRLDVWKSKHIYM